MTTPPAAPSRTPIRTLLVANRGEIACRVLRTAQALGMRTVAVFSDADVDAPHVGQADLAVRLPGVAAADTYLRGDLLVRAALRTGADAVHPGYGFLSENADFVRQVADAGLVFVGPSADVVAAMGSKVEAKARMAAAGVPVLPGATVTDDADIAALGRCVGYPLLVKASAGGGGRGMRVVPGPADLAGAVAAARREAAAAFGDDTVFLERYLRDPRHVEVQIFGDAAGTVVSLFERECSVQRRFQKVVEEAPSPAVTPELRERLSAAATTAGRALGYVGAGTVEFVLDAGGDFHFLEVNTRLQVEHPVTELVTGLDLVRLQLLVAQGEPLPAEARTARLSGHAVEVRLYAEDPVAGYRPTTGRLRAFAVPGPVRVDAGVAAGQVVGPHYDALLAKVVAHAPTRGEAAAVLAGALRAARLHGVGTNRDLLVAVLGEPEFLAGGTDTGYLERHPPAALLVPDPAARADAVTAAVVALRAVRRAAAAVQRSVTAGWRNVTSADPVVRLAWSDGGVLDVGYQVVGDTVRVRLGDQPLGPAARVGVVGEDGGHRVTLERDGVRRSWHVAVEGDHLDVSSSAGSLDLRVVDLLPEPEAAGPAGSLAAPLPGLVVRTEAAPGEPVALGQPLLVLEAMKMEHVVRAPHDGVLTSLLVRTGDQVEVGQPLAVLGGPTGGAE
ncbi:Acetyl/propionyl-CoA carboxylase, alpha subunit [Friedmanniella luteola]|uniref:Acetyl/propionyl-CoA carboxylase, alpha subunit n=1 Tax=Friedmanniella luteola TaxID=546871 RepID=A0A1H1ZQS0_9ACTN|nr:biotin carboxylase N-terminal domain-containing protein [Friedmanniella luteola]SDT36145.1 Acetyl/propionyl-CoA carboxylase, alpha subunit [Friedmanniella luteola]